MSLRSVAKALPWTISLSGAFTRIENDIVCDDNAITTTLPEVQTARAGSFDRELFITMGKSFGLNTNFLSACSGIRFRVTHSGISQEIYSGNNGEIIAGYLIKLFCGRRRNRPMTPKHMGWSCVIIPPARSPGI